jgi:hypothetical protein
MKVLKTFFIDLALAAVPVLTITAMFLHWLYIGY